MTVLGTRPEIIRLSRVIPLLDQLADHVLVHTGQNWDDRLNGIFFRELGLRTPDHNLGADTSSLGATMGDILRKIEGVLAAERPDAFLVLGDTNSAISAVMARRMHVPVYHMEAGNRSFDENVPEEVNRRLVDHVADFNLAYTEHARRNLLAEGLHPRRVAVTGSPMWEVLQHYSADIAASTTLQDLDLTSGEYFVASMHREENVDSRARLTQLLECLRRLADDSGMPVILSTHPRTRKRLEELGADGDDAVRMLPPFGFFDYIALQQASRCAVSDSGTISEEAAMLGFPAVTLRDSMERPEALEAGSVLMSGLDPAELLRNVQAAIASGPQVPPPAYQVRNTAQRTVNFILSTAGRHGDWFGLRS
ncbi:non-hydrolyzing UDP-N-acetylglucosamine 2-epimerase [Nocardioides endophyticus]